MNDHDIDLKTIHTTCPYCGVGCGIEATVDQQNHKLTIQGDTSHPANFGRLCSKGSALAETLELNSRLLEPVVYGRQCNWSEALDIVADSFISIIRKHGPHAVAIYGSGQLLTEDYYVANKLMKGFIGSGNMDTNSRLCMSSAVAGHKRAFGSDTVPGCYEDYEQAEMILLVGSNTAWCHPVSFQRIRTAKENNPDLKIVVIDPRHTSSCDIADLHLPVAIGSDTVLFNGLLNYLYEHDALDSSYIQQHTEGWNKTLQSAQNSSRDMQQVAELCQLKQQDIAQFYQWFASHKKVMSLYSQGINQSSSGTDKVNSIINCHLATGSIGQPGMGPFSLTGQPNAMGGREVGGLTHQLAAHMDFSRQDDIDRVAQFWNTDTIATKPGYFAVDLFDAVYDGKVKAIWIMGTNPVVSLPNADKVKKALQRCDFVVVSDCIADTDTTELAHVKLPALGWSEKNGTITNSERRISRQRALFEPSGSAKPDWWIITQVARRMGYEQAFHYTSNVEIFREHAALSGYQNTHEQRLRDFDISAFSELSQDEYDQLQPVQWPVNKQHPQGLKRLFADGQFYTPSGKAQFVAIEPTPPAHLPDPHYPLILNTGRLRDQWHSMTRTALAVKLNQHKPEPFIEVHPVDASQFELIQHSLAVIQSHWGEMIARVQITDTQKQGTLFVPIHWSAQFASHGRIGALVNPAVDAISKQPESKHTPVRIKPYHTAWHGFILSRHPLQFANPDYLVKIKGDQFYRYEMAGKDRPESWPEWTKKKLCRDDLYPAQWQEYADPEYGIYRAARLLNDGLESIVFIAPDFNLPDRNWLSSLFLKTELNRNERLALLTGKPPLGEPDVGTIVCSCFNIGEKTILAEIKAKSLTTHQDVGLCLKAGTNCGSCIPEIKALL